MDTNHDIHLLYKQYRIHDAFKAIIARPASDYHYLLLFQRILQYNWNLFQLKDFASLMRQRAVQGDSKFQYAWARYNDALRPEENSIDIAIEYYTKAADGGIPDAIMCLARLWQQGEFGPVDNEKYVRLGQKALEQGSEMADIDRYSDTIYGGDSGHSPDPERVYNAVTKYIFKAERAGSDINAAYYRMVGEACERLERTQEASSWYERAFDAGDPWACMRLAIHYGRPDDNGSITSVDDFMKIVNKGLRKGIPDCGKYPLLLPGAAAIDTLPEFERARRHTEIREQLTEAFDMGYRDAAYFLGISYRNGWYGFGKDSDSAWNWYLHGAILNAPDCYREMADMIRSGDAPSGYDEEFMHKCELMAVRLGDESSVSNVVKAYFKGWLKDYSKEIERIYFIKYFDSCELQEDYNNGIINDRMYDKVCEMYFDGEKSHLEDLVRDYQYDNYETTD